jgi:hypothetical protein
VPGGRKSRTHPDDPKVPVRTGPSALLTSPLLVETSRVQPLPSTVQASRASGPPSVAPGRRKGLRLTTATHSEFVSSLIEQFEATIAAGSRSDILRLVRVLEAMDGPASRRKPAALSLPRTVLETIDDLGLPVAVSGRPGEEYFVADADRLRAGLELALIALTGTDGDGGLSLEIRNDRLVVIEGWLDPADATGCWQMRYGRLILEGEGCRVLLIGGVEHFTLHIRAGR